MQKVRWTDEERNIVYSYLKAKGLNDVNVYEFGYMKKLMMEAEQHPKVRVRFTETSNGFNRQAEYILYKKWLDKDDKAAAVGATLTEQTQARANKAVQERVQEAIGKKLFQIPPGTPTSEPGITMEAATPAAVVPAQDLAPLDKLNGALAQIGDYINDQLQQITQDAQAAQAAAVPPEPAATPGTLFTEILTQVKQEIVVMGEALRADLKFLVEEQSVKTRNLICAMHDSLMKTWDPNYKTDHVEEIKILEQIPEGFGTQASPRRRKIAIITNQPRHFYQVAEQVKGVDFEFILPARAGDIKQDTRFDLIVATRLIDHGTNDKLKSVHGTKFMYIGHGTKPLINAIKERLVSLH